MIGLDLIITIQHSLECQNLVAAITPNANQDLALAPPPLSSVGLAITHQAQVSIAPQTTSGFARAYQTFISNLGNSGTYQDINVGIESNTDLPLEVAHVLMDLHQNINDPRSVGLAITHQAQVSIAPQTSNANQDLALALAPPPSSSVGLAITHQA
ncbi:unnamed protein product [Gordionus sp. m RMFG-2023]